MADLIHAVEIECLVEMWAECPKCLDDFNVINSLGRKEKAFDELLRGFPSPTPGIHKVVANFDLTCPNCNYRMRAVAFNFDLGW